jgi:hypothetical protein
MHASVQRKRNINPKNKRKRNERKFEEITCTKIILKTK